VKQLWNADFGLRNGSLVSTATPLYAGIGVEVVFFALAMPARIAEAVAMDEN